MEEIGGATHSTKVNQKCTVAPGRTDLFLQRDIDEMQDVYTEQCLAAEKVLVKPIGKRIYCWDAHKSSTDEMVSVRVRIFSISIGKSLDQSLWVMGRAIVA